MLDWRRPTGDALHSKGLPTAELGESSKGMAEPRLFMVERRLRVGERVAAGSSAGAASSSSSSLSSSLMELPVS